MPMYPYLCGGCGGQTVRWQKVMTETSEPIDCGCGGKMIRVFSAEIQLNTRPFTSEDGNRYYGGRITGGVFSSKAQVEYLKQKEKEYERKHRPSQNPVSV